MKKYLLVIIITFIIICLFSPQIKANEDHEWVINETSEYLGNFTPQKVIPVIDSEIYIFIYEYSFQIINKKVAVLTINSKYEGYYYDENNANLNIYTNKVIYMINTKTFLYSSFEIAIDEIKGMAINEGIYYYWGRHQNDAIIVAYNQAHEMINYCCYGGSGEEGFNQGFYINHHFIISGTKDAHSANSELANCGNLGDKKAFLLAIDENFNIINSYYFNELTSNEVIDSIVNINEIFNIILTTPKGEYSYQLDSSFNLKERYQIEANNEYYEVDTNNSDEISYHCYVENKITNKTILFNVYLSTNLIDSYTLNEKGLVKGCWVKKGILNIVVSNEKGLSIVRINEYKVLYVNDQYLNRLNVDYHNQDHFKVFSYLEDLTFIEKGANPYYNPNINGEYQIVYEAKRMNGETIRILTKRIVEDYVNIMNNGVYPVGYALSFSGEAKLNNEVCYNGTILNEGSKTLVIKDANGKEKTYNFEVVSMYYKNRNIINIPKVELVKNNTITKVQIKNQLIPKLVDIYINNQPYENYEISSDILTINIPHVNYDTTTLYNLNYFTYYDNNELKKYIINKPLTFQIQKSLPQLEIDESITADEVIIDIDIKDPHQTASYLRIDIYNQQDNKIDSCNYYFTNPLVLCDNIPKNEDIKMKIYFVYEIDPTCMLEEEIMETSINISNKVNEVVKITSNMDNQTLSNINIKINNKNTTINSLQLGKADLSEYVEKETSYIWLYISLVFTGLIIVGTISIKVIRSHKH